MIIYTNILHNFLTRQGKSVNFVERDCLHVTTIAFKQIVDELIDLTNLCEYDITNPRIDYLGYECAGGPA